MKKILITLLTFVITLQTIAQTTVDTTISGWNAIITYPSDYATEPEKTYNMIVFFPGAGEAGGTHAQLRYMGIHSYVANGGWNGEVTISNGTHKLILVSLSQSPTYDINSIARARVNTLLSFLRVKEYALTGLSAGGHCAMTMATEDAYDNTPPYGAFPYADGIQAIFSAQGVQPDDNADYVNKCKNFVRNNVGGRYLGIWGTADGSRQMPEMAASMNAAVANSAIVLSTADAHNKTAFDKYYGSSSAPQTYNIEGTQQTIYQWLLRQMDTTLTDVVSPVTADAGSNITITLPRAGTYLDGSGSSSTGGDITAYSWEKISGGDTTWLLRDVDKPYVSGLQEGTYQFELTATDENSDTGKDTVQVTVRGSFPCNENEPQTYIIGSGSGDLYYPNAAAQPWRGGDTIKITAGTYDALELDSLQGDFCKPIIIMPLSGDVTFTNHIRFYKDGHNFILDGRKAGGGYGFKTKVISINKCSDFTIRNVEVRNNSGGVGVYCKQDPLENMPYNWHPSYTMKNITFDSLYIHNVEGEGMYIGHTQPSGDEAHEYLIPIRLDSVKITNVIVDSTGWDGIQLSNARHGAEISNNTISNFGLLDLNSQRAGLILGGNTNGKVFNNSVKRGTGNGIQIFGFGEIEVYSNTVDSAGLTGTHTDGEQSIYTFYNSVTPETNAGQKLHIHDNQINYPRVRGAIDTRDDYDLAQTHNISDNKFCFLSTPSEGWQATYLKIQPAGSTVANNILSCTTDPLPPQNCNCFKGLLKLL